MSEPVRDDEAVQAWLPPDVSPEADGMVHVSQRRQEEDEPDIEPLTAEQIEAIQQQAHEEGFAQGRREGREAGLKEARQQVRKIESILNTLARPLEELDEAVVEQMVDLSITIARHLVRRELHADPGQVVAVVREAIAALPVGSRGIRVHLHPEDARLVREALSVAESEEGWHLVEDPAMARGGCNVLTEDARVDATVEKRLAAIIARLLGGDREEDVTSPPEDGRQPGVE